MLRAGASGRDFAQGVRAAQVRGVGPKGRRSPPSVDLRPAFERRRRKTAGTLAERQVGEPPAPRRQVPRGARVSPASRRSPAPPARGARDVERAGHSPFRGRALPNGRGGGAPAHSGGEVRRFPRRLFRQRRRQQSWEEEEEVEAGGNPRSGRRLEVTSRAEPERRAASVSAPTESRR